MATRQHSKTGDTYDVELALAGYSKDDIQLTMLTTC